MYKGGGQVLNTSLNCLRVQFSPINGMDKNDIGCKEEPLKNAKSEKEYRSTD